MVGVASGSLQADSQPHSPGRLAWSKGRLPLGAVPRSSYEPGELSQKLCYDDSIINVIMLIIIIIIIIIIIEGRNVLLPSVSQ